MAPKIDESIVAKGGEIRSLPYAKSITSEEVIERNFGYKIVRQQVSSGKNSMIYKCESHKHPELFCVIKAYRLGKEKVKLSFREEVSQIMRYVTGKCPQLISTYDMYYTNEKIYLMCDWSSRGDVLSNIKKRTVRLNEKTLRDWTTDILSAVSFLHSNAICHRNIAPSCLLLTADNRVKIGTLGDAVIYCKQDGSLIKQKWPKFSRLANWNQPPEVAKDKAYDPRRADIWSIGATVYWFITKKHPIDYRSSNRLTAQLEQRLNYMHKVTPTCQNFVRKMLTYQPPSRPTIEAAIGLDWITSTGAGNSAKSPKEMVEIEANVEKTAEPGEAGGTEESEQTVAEPSASMSTSRKQNDAETEPEAEQ